METVLASAVFRKPFSPVHNREQQLDELGVKLADSIRKILANARDKLYTGEEQVGKIEPHRILKNKTLELNNLKSRTNAATKAVINKARIQLTAQANRLAALNPKSVLQRGYSITTNKKTGLLVRNLEDVKIEDLLITELAGENLIESRVTKK
ncbi:MAG TPA: hypothetical protein ENH43_02695 [Phycisphaerales bacterium]|nr:hypothetical protein [Phycisphaerales bacterium]